MPRIFISYKRADMEKVFELKDQIEAATGEKCWIDLDGIESDAFESANLFETRQKALGYRVFFDIDTLMRYYKTYGNETKIF